MTFWFTRFQVSSGNSISSLEARYQFSTPGLWTLWDSVDRSEHVKLTFFFGKSFGAWNFNGIRLDIP
ncbi:uncharacterized protein OCT59_002140 [Rhizophagus irregularis]|uniref:uncharacterized protein n=1 Tax=Rhizophagus irregularis TaxID=588596 RepID=UPI0033207CA0|nr:hypothetical protein OCT59_002140 [Rhizophagus irregularis]